CYLTDLWSMRFLHDPATWSADRLHLAPQAHHRVALRAAEVLGLPLTEDWRASLAPAATAGMSPALGAPDGTGSVLAVVPGAAPPSDAPPSDAAVAAVARVVWLAARREDARWAREYLVPWINRRLHGTSSGDGLPPKRPALQPVTPA